MAPQLAKVMARTNFQPGIPADEFRTQWTHPGDVFSVLLILGGDVVARALAQLAGGWWTPVTFSFGWVAYAVSALVSAVGENKLMPPTPDCVGKVINGENGYVRDNSSWILGRVLRDFDYWRSQPTEDLLKKILDDKWRDERDKAKKAGRDERLVERPVQAGLCVSVYEQSSVVKAGQPKHDLVYYSGFAVAILQLGIAAIPCGVFGDWGILMITSTGILLAFASGMLPQWKKEKWACRRKSSKPIILTRGNGAQHALVIFGNGKGLDLEDLAAGPSNIDVSASRFTRVATGVLALFWILLLITASGQKQNTWFLLAVGGLGIVHNTAVAGWPRQPSAFGIHLRPARPPIGHFKVMEALYAVEAQLPHVGRSMRDTFFPGELREDEKECWKQYAITAKKFDAEKKAKRLEKEKLAKEANEVKKI